VSNAQNSIPQIQQQWASENSVLEPWFQRGVSFYGITIRAANAKVSRATHRTTFSMSLLYSL
jgi:hypothetical protein